MIDVAALYVEYQPRVQKFINHSVRNKELAEDMTSEVFCRLLDAIQRGSGPTLYEAGYLWKIVRNVIIDQWRRDNRVKILNWTDYDPADEPDDTEDPLFRHNILITPDTLDLQLAITEDVQRAVKRLTAKQREVITLQLHGYDFEEIAQIIGVSYVAAKTLRHRGIVTLRRKLRHWNHEQQNKRQYWRNQKPK